MSEKGGVIAYIIQAHIGAPITLCVMDEAKQAYHQFPLTAIGAARLAYECAGCVSSELGGFTRTLKKPE